MLNEIAVLLSLRKKALEEHWDKFGINFSESKINLTDVFHRTAPKVLDIGTGMGDSTLSLAKRFPENDYLAVEVHLPGVGSLIHKVHKANINNIRIINQDIQDVLDYQLAGKSIDIIFIFFPDPWHKKRHHKRRLINTDFLKKLITVLKLHGRLFIATDWLDYAEQIINVTDQIPELINLAGNNKFIPRPEWRPLTKFEKRGINLEHGVWDMAFSVSPVSH